MRMSYALHRRLAWLALCALVFGVFAPSVSKLLAASADVAWLEICSADNANGTRLVALDLGVKKTPDAPHAADDHCGYCLLQQHSLVVPTAPKTLKLTSVASDRVPIGSGGSTVFKRFVRDAHPARAPPVFC